MSCGFTSQSQMGAPCICRSRSQQHWLISNLSFFSLNFNLAVMIGCGDIIKNVFLNNETDTSFDWDQLFFKSEHSGRSLQHNQPQNYYANTHRNSLSHKTCLPTSTVDGAKRLCVEDNISKRYFQNNVERILPLVPKRNASFTKAVGGADKDSYNSNEVSWLNNVSENELYKASARNSSFCYAVNSSSHATKVSECYKVL